MEIGYLINISYQTTGLGDNNGITISVLLEYHKGTPNMGRIMTNESFQRCVRIRSVRNNYVALDMWMYDAGQNTV